MSCCEGMFVHAVRDVCRRGRRVCSCCWLLLLIIEGFVLWKKLVHRAALNYNFAT